MLLQEYAPMGSLYDLLQEREKISEEKILTEIFLQIIDAMSFLALNNVVHGDLACRNVLMFRFDEVIPRNIIVKVTDFGLSRHSKLYGLTSSAARTTLNIVPIRYAAPEILAVNVTPDDCTEKSDVYSMGVLMWEAYSRGMIPWTKIDNDNEVVRRVTNGELLPKPPKCSDISWSIICETWKMLPRHRPIFAELKYRLMGQDHNTSSSSSLSTNDSILSIDQCTVESLSITSREFSIVGRRFLDGWPNAVRSRVHAKAIHKINNRLLESRYREFLNSNSKFASRQCFAWHGTSAKCNDGSCMSASCCLCHIIRNRFREECMRKRTISFNHWGAATYFSSKSFVCHSYSRRSELDYDGTRTRCTIMATINYGNTFDQEKFNQYLEYHEEIIGGRSECFYIPRLVHCLMYDTVVFSRNYYNAPTDYILVYTII